jgi:hypothetical protein
MLVAVFSTAAMARQSIPDDQQPAGNGNRELVLVSRFAGSVAKITVHEVVVRMLGFVSLFSGNQLFVQFHKSFRRREKIRLVEVVGAEAVIARNS